MPGFIPDLPVILAFALAAVVLAITPGPDMALQVSRAVNYGRAHGLATAAGAMSGVVVHTSLVAFGISVLIVAAPALFLMLKIAGSVYLLWLAWQAIVAAGDPHAAGKLFFLGAEFIVVSIPLAIATVVAAGRLAGLFRSSRWVERTLNYGFAAVFATFAAVILSAQARH